MAKDAAEREKMDDAARKEAKKVDRAIEPLKEARERAQKTYDRASREENASKSKNAYESAAAQFVKVVAGIDKLKVEVDPAQVARARRTVVDEAVRAYLKAGNIALHRGSYKDAKDLGEKALKVDGESSSAKALLAQIETASAMDDTFDTRYRRRGNRRRGR